MCERFSARESRIDVRVVAIPTKVEEADGKKTHDNPAIREMAHEGANSGVARTLDMGEISGT